MLAPFATIRIALVLVVALATAGTPYAQSATAPTLKAAFLYNFAKFTEWPAEVLPAAAPIELCVAGDTPVAKALEDATKGRDVEGHRIVVRKIDLQGAIQSCHVLYVEQLDTKRAVQLVERSKSTPVLTVSDFNRFAQMGGSTEFFVEDGRMRFAVNLDATVRSKLRLSSRLLSLAKIVKDDPNALKP